MASSPSRRSAEDDHHRIEAAFVDTYHGEVVVGGGAEHAPRELALVGEDDLDALGVLNDVVVGEDDPLRVDDDAGALALPAAAEQVFEEPARAASGRAR